MYNPAKESLLTVTELDIHINSKSRDNSIDDFSLIHSSDIDLDGDEGDDTDRGLDIDTFENNHIDSAVNDEDFVNEKMIVGIQVTLFLSSLSSSLPSSLSSHPSHHHHHYDHHYNYRQNHYHQYRHRHYHRLIIIFF